MADDSEPVGAGGQRLGRRAAAARANVAAQSAQSPIPTPLTDNTTSAAAATGGGGWGAPAAAAPVAANGGGGGWGGPVAANGTTATATTPSGMGGGANSGDAKQGRRRLGDEAAKRAAAADDDRVVDMQEIPDLEEAIQDDITTKVAQAPNVRAHKVQALTELDSEIVNQLPTLPDGIDLSLLTNALTPLEKCAEVDHAWDYDVLFTAVSSEIQTELDAANGDAADKDDDDAPPPASQTVANAAPLRPRMGDYKDEKN